MGHAKINLRLSISDETKPWIEAYCCKITFEEYQKEHNEVTYEEYIAEVEKVIPVRIKKVNIREAYLSDTWTLEPSDEGAYSEEVFD